MIRKKNKYTRPRQIFESERIKEENLLAEKYGLKNKKEIWKTKAKVDHFRRRAKALAKSPIEEQEVLFRKLKALGLKTENIADVLNLQVEDLLKRRLPTVIANKKIANTPKQGRQMVVHKRILIGGEVTNTPSYLVKVAEESKITLKKKTLKKPAPKEEPAPTEETPSEVSQEETPDNKGNTEKVTSQESAQAEEVVEAEIKGEGK